MDVFIHRLQAGIGQMIASLNGRPDAIVFTDAIGEDEPLVRSRACEPFKNPVRVLIVKSREDWQIARECQQLLESKARR